MNGVRQGWLVAAREMRERSRSRAFRASLVMMMLLVAAVVIVPSVVDLGGGTRDIGLSGSTPNALAETIKAQSNAVGTKARVRRYNSVAAGEEAVRHGHVDVLVIDARRLEWPRRTDEQLRAVVTGAIQLLAVRERATATGISPDALRAIVAPVRVRNVELGTVAGRSPDDETVAMVMGVILLVAIATYGSLVLAGVVEEKGSRVVEVLLARMPARSLLAGKITGIGLLGLAQIGATAVVAVVAMAAVDSVDVPAARGSVIAWVVVWFVLGYALYATLFGALGSLASRPEDASSVTGPVTAVLLVAYWASFLAIGSPDSSWARVIALFPATAPMAMPGRIAMGAAAWWEPALAVALTLAAITALVLFAGRVYTGAVLHTGATLKLREAWRGTTTQNPSAVTRAHHASTSTWMRQARAMAAGKPRTTSADGMTGRWTNTALIGIAAGVGIAIGVLTGDVIVGLAVGAALYAIATRIVKARSS